MTTPTLYNHAFEIAFSLQTPLKSDDEIPAGELLAALKARVAYLEQHPDELLEACGKPFNSYEVGEAPPPDIHEENPFGRTIIVLAKPGGDIESIYFRKISTIPDVVVKVNHGQAIKLELCENQAFLDQVFHHLRMAGYAGETFGRAEGGRQGSTYVTLEPNAEFEAFARTVGWVDQNALEKEFRDKYRDESATNLRQTIRDLGIEYAVKDVVRHYEAGGMSDDDYRRRLISAIVDDEVRHYEPPVAAKPKP